MILTGYFSQFKNEVKVGFETVKDLFYKYYENPLMWLIILGLTVLLVMGAYNSLNKK